VESVYTMRVSKTRSNRGFLLTKTKYRNIPEWQIAIELQKYSDLPLIIDPSHITGDRDDS
jgi:chorismate mutase